jgi:hypothetical protein
MRVVRVWWLGLALLALACTPLLAADDAEEVFESTAAVRESLEREVSPETAGETATEVISQFFPEVEVDEGTYPASEFVEQNFLLRRQGPAKGTYSGRFFTKYSNDDISGVEKFEKELELYLGYKNLTSYLRFSDVNAIAGNNDPFRFEKANVNYKYDSGNVTVGSFGEVFGRGLALNMFEDRFTELDNEAEGIKLEQELGEGEVTALWGHRKLRNLRHGAQVSGLRVQQPLGDSLDLGIHGVHVETPPDVPNDATIKEMMEYDLIGGDVTLRAGDFNAYIETVRLKRGPEQRFGNGVADFQGLDGRGYYATAAYGIPGFSLSAEYKDYQGLLQPFSVLPPIRRWWEKAQAEATDDVGYGFDLNLSPGGDGSQWSAHYAQDNSHEGNRAYTESNIIYSSPAQRSFTYVGEYWKVYSNSAHHNIKRLTANQQLNSDWTASSLLEHERITGDGFGYADYIIDAELAYRSELNLIYFYEATTADTLDERSAWKLWEVKWHPTEDQEIHFLYGARRAGFVCSGGVCREEPAFEGFRVDYLLRF